MSVYTVAYSTISDHIKYALRLYSTVRCTSMVYAGTKQQMLRDVTCNVQHTSTSSDSYPIKIRKGDNVWFCNYIARVSAQARAHRHQQSLLYDHRELVLPQLIILKTFLSPLLSDLHETA